MKNRKILTHLTALLLAAALLLSLCPSVFAEASEAEAETETQTAAETETDEIIRIETADDLLALSKSCTLDTWSVGKTVALEAGISLDGTAFSPHPQLQRHVPRQRPFHPWALHHHEAFKRRTVSSHRRNGRGF